MTRNCSRRRCVRSALADSGHVRTTSRPDLVWLVSGTNGENQLRAEGATSAEAWLQAVEQAKGLGLMRG